jgi:hypothetical protein
MIRTFACVTFLLGLTVGYSSWVFAQTPDDIRELKLRDWQPRSMLKTQQSVVEKPAYPVIDVHNHLGGGKEYLTPDRVKNYLAEMDAAGIRTVVNLDGGWGQELTETLSMLDEPYPGRFLTFALLDFDGLMTRIGDSARPNNLKRVFRPGRRD